MAEQVTDMTRVPPQVRYPWVDWFNGEWWRLTEDDIISRNTTERWRTFRAYCYTAARNKNCYVTTRFAVEDGETVLYLRRFKGEPVHGRHTRSD